MTHDTRKQDTRSRWMMALASRRGAQVAAVAIANHHTRVSWALLAARRSLPPRRRH